MVAQGKNKNSCGYIWRYGADTNDIEEEILIQYTKKPYRANTVNQYDLSGNLLASFESITEAARKTGVNRRKLNHHILLQTPEFEGYVWRHTDQLNNK